MTPRNTEPPGPGEGEKNREPAEPMDAKDVAEKDAGEYDEPTREDMHDPGMGGDVEHKEKTKLSDNDLTT